VYSPLTRDFRTWKRYEGGWAQDLYIFDLGKDRSSPWRAPRAPSAIPMWIGDAIYFASDRDGTLNLFATTVKDQVEQLTHEHDWDVRWPSKGEDGEIVYEYDGELVLSTPRRGARSSSRSACPTTACRCDRRASGGRRDRGLRALAQGRARAVRGARRRLQRADREGPDAQPDAHSGVHERDAVWAPDGGTIVFLSDASGEDELWRVPQDGAQPPEALTHDGKLRRAGLRFAPDGKRLAFADADGVVSVLDLETRAVRAAARDVSGNVGDYAWSPDGRWLALSLTDPNRQRSIQIWSARTAGCSA
jgi:tricorn protease